MLSVISYQKEDVCSLGPLLLTLWKHRRKLWLLFLTLKSHIVVLPVASVAFNFILLISTSSGIYIGFSGWIGSLCYIHV